MMWPVDLGTSLWPRTRLATTYITGYQPDRLMWREQQQHWPPCNKVVFRVDNQYAECEKQQQIIAKSMHEHLCIVALTSNGARIPVLSACLLPPRVIAYCSSSTSRWITGSCTWIMKILIIMVLCCAVLVSMIVLDLSLLFDNVPGIGLSSLLLVSLHGD